MYSAARVYWYLGFGAKSVALGDVTSALVLPLYLQDAYSCAEEFCRLLGRRVKGAGFLKTLLLRRLGSSIRAGELSAIVRQ